MGGKSCRPGRAWCSSPGCCYHGPIHGTAVILLQTLFGNSCFSHLPACSTAILTTHFVSGICVRVSGQAAHTLRVNQLMPYPIYSCHLLIYNFHGAIKIKTLSSVFQDLFFTHPTFCYAGDSPPTGSSPRCCAACGLWSQCCLGN